MRTLCERLLGNVPKPRVATHTSILNEDHERIDDALVLFFAAPHSYTGEDLAEFQVHGSPIIVREVLRVALKFGARLARPGEFTQRAFLNAKLDLHAASAVADIIDAESRAAVRAALANLGGSLAQSVRSLRAQLVHLLEELAAAIDYPDEVPEPHRVLFSGRISEALRAMDLLQRDGERGRMIREGLAVAIVGPPNAGKSSLLNALLGEDRAIVSDVAGTTRDTIEERIILDGVALRLIDTAGIRDHSDRIEAMGIERSRRAIEQADIVLLVVDGSQPLAQDGHELLRTTDERTRIVLWNKMDLVPHTHEDFPPENVVYGSAHDSVTLDALRLALARVGWGGQRIDVARPHLSAAHEFSALAQARVAVIEADEVCTSGEPLDLAAPALARAITSLGKITGDEVVEELLDGIFARFCIGK